MTGFRSPRGVICPPRGVDPGIVEKPPATNAPMPVIPPWNAAWRSWRSTQAARSARRQQPILPHAAPQARYRRPAPLLGNRFLWWAIPDPRTATGQAPVATPRAGSPYRARGGAIPGVPNPDRVAPGTLGDSASHRKWSALLSDVARSLANGAGVAPGEAFGSQPTRLAMFE